MKLTVTGIEKMDAKTMKLCLSGEASGNYTCFIYLPWADRGKYELESEFEMELWAVMEEPADQREDTPERQYRPGGVMNNGL